MAGRLRELLAKYEGQKLFVYDDATGLPIKPGSVVVGHPTIGRGRALDTHGVSAIESDFLEANDVERVQKEALCAFDFFKSLSVVRSDVLCCMVFQLGLDGVKEFKAMLEALRVQNYEKAAAEMLDSHWFEETPARARELSELMRTGAYPTSGQ